MANAMKILLVEGESDKSFFEEVCELLKLDTKIQVAPPRDIGGVHNSKQGIFKQLSILLNQFADGTLTHLAVIMDADYKSEHGLGCQATISQMETTLAPFGFNLKRNSDPKMAGLFFTHPDGFKDLGFWVMPNNRDEGMLEDWIKNCVSPSEQTLFQHAVATTTALTAPKFKEIHRSKAEVATWLAWQKTPGHGPYSALRESCIDPESAQFKQLASWLRLVFQ
ncbi:hypothetical protein AAKU61_004076 [Undibacterium sp. GrIS 1.2]|uniref:DUF3226 domain-containing protein n=1 Tax=Undibacterium sp. GrIS 1.2 TaxID=3143933 RepID=UPI00339AE103